MIRRVLAIAAMLLLVPATAAYAQYNPGQPGFIITPSTTTAGSQVSFVGEGCPAGSTVTFTSNGVTLASGPVGSDGKFAVPGTVPASFGPGQYTVTATCGDVLMTNILTVVAATSGVIPGTSGTSGSLPRTGSDSMLLVRIGLGLLAAGGLVVLATRRRRAMA